METTENKKRILIVDDNVNLTTVLVDKFNLSGFEAQSAANGEEGLSKALEWKPDLILLDLVMPVMDGLEMLSQLREDAWGKEARVMVLSLLDEATYISKTMDKNVLGYIIKTDFSLDGIVKKITDTLKGIK